MSTVCGQIFNKESHQWEFTTCFASDCEDYRREVRKELREKFPNHARRLMVTNDDGQSSGVACCDDPDCVGPRCKREPSQDEPTAESSGNSEAILAQLVAALAAYLDLTGRRGRGRAVADVEVGGNGLDDRTEEEQRAAAERYRGYAQRALRTSKAVGGHGLLETTARLQVERNLAAVPPRRKGMIARLMPGGDLSGC